MFERVADREKLCPGQWSEVSVPYLTGEPQKTYFDLALQDAKQYGKLKAEILACLGPGGDNRVAHLAGHKGRLYRGTKVSGQLKSSFLRHKKHDPGKWFKPGDQVWVLVPTVESKFKWYGPFEVVERVCDDNYKIIKFTNQRKGSSTSLISLTDFHVYNGSSSSVNTFTFLGFGDQVDLQIFLFLVFMFMYLITVIGNLAIILLIATDTHLHSPMYIFLSNLAFVDLWYSSSITPKMLVDLITVKKSISYIGCAVQMYFFIALGSTESFLLAAMAFDRYVAICILLLYLKHMTRMKYLQLLSGSYGAGFLHSLIQTCCTFRLSFCGSHYIRHFFCDIPPVLKLSCSDTTINEFILSIFASSVIAMSIIVIVISYASILHAVFTSNSSKGRRKAFSTCGSHFICVILFYSTVCFMYIRPSSAYSLEQDRIVSVVYSLVIPMLNPLIYSLRNREMKLALKRTFAIKSISPRISKILFSDRFQGI
ncbi:olfactory receptor 5F1-like [Phyllobates terribilis]|uniref:olfactory receptor 5F1-like n=1 Tax=Phyllobates terribilis TaxID=111132 RepID=UPI003CCB2228